LCSTAPPSARPTCRRSSPGPYRATLRLGERSSTGDAEGEITPGTAPAFDRAALEAACAALTGAIEQLPPMHSALKKDGRPLYDYARAGQTVDRAPRRVTVHRLDIVEWQDRQLVIDVVCGKGTYIRTLAADLGDRLGCGAWLAALRRTASGPFRVGDAVTLDALAALDEAAREAWLLPPDALLAGTRSATSPSSPTSTTAKPPWWTSCCASRGTFRRTRKSRRHA
jgi:tRNA pseudouridine55 synthase